MSTDADSLWLVVKSVERSWVFEMPAEGSRIVTMGTAEHVDIRLSAPSAPPLACYFEREGDAIRIVPAYLSEHLRVDTTAVDRPRWILRRSVVELPGVVLHLRVRDEPPTSPNCEPVKVHPQATLQKARVLPPVGTTGGPLCTTMGRGIALGELELLCGGLSEVLSAAPPSGAEAQRSGRIDGEFAPEMGERITASPIILVGESPEERPAHRDAPVLEARVDYAPLSTAPSVVSVRAPRQREPRDPLSWLGEQARHRPLAVAMGASLGSLVLVLLMLGVVRIGRVWEGQTVAAGHAGHGLAGHSHAGHAHAGHALTPAVARPAPSLADIARGGNGAATGTVPLVERVGQPAAAARP